MTTSNTPTRVDALAAAILTAEGRHHVAGRYYADERDATTMRRVEAERRARLEHQAELRRDLLASRWEVTEAGRRVVAAEREFRQLRDALTDLVDDRECDIDTHGICLTHDEPCSHVTGRFVCPVSRARTLLSAAR
jgi:hypothetical protein